MGNCISDVSAFVGRRFKWVNVQRGDGDDECTDFRVVFTTLAAEDPIHAALVEWLIDDGTVDAPRQCFPPPVYPQWMSRPGCQRTPYCLLLLQ